MAALTIRANRRSHTNVLMHLQGYFKRMLTPAQKQELCEAIDKYRTGVFPLLVPLTLIRHYLREHPNPYLSDQVYLNPHPGYVETALRALKTWCHMVEQRYPDPHPDTLTLRCGL